MTQAGQQTLDLSAAVNVSPAARQSPIVFLGSETLGLTVDRAFEIEALKAFELAIEILGATAKTAEEIAASGAKSLGEMEARGDRIDRLNAENRRALNQLLRM